jgi:hypothetical protein
MAVKYFITFSPASPDHSGSAWPADPASMQGRLEQMEAVRAYIYKSLFQFVKVKK